MEGGYDPLNVARGVDAVFAALTCSAWQDPQDPSPHKEPRISELLDATRKTHGF
jgi:acetoin utilization deacetylase AcuC-like enzyme